MFWKRLMFWKREKPPLPEKTHERMVYGPAPARFKVGDLVWVPSYVEATGVIVEIEQVTREYRHFNYTSVTTSTLYNVLVTSAMLDAPFLSKIQEEYLRLLPKPADGDCEPNDTSRP